MRTEDLEPGQFLLFRAATTASLTSMIEGRGAPDGFTVEGFACLQELIGNLDGSGCTHSAIVSRVTDGEVWVIDQTGNTAERRLTDCCVPYGGNPAMVLELKDASTRAGAVDAAQMRVDDDPRPYSIQNMLLLSILLRVRADFEELPPDALEAIEGQLAELATENLGRTCGSLMAEILSDIGFEPEEAERGLAREFEPDPDCGPATTEAFKLLGSSVALSDDAAREYANYVRTGEDPIAFIQATIIAFAADDPVSVENRNKLYAEVMNARRGIAALWSPNDLLQSDALEYIGDLDQWC